MEESKQVDVITALRQIENTITAAKKFNERRKRVERYLSQDDLPPLPKMEFSSKVANAPPLFNEENYNYIKVQI